MAYGITLTIPKEIEVLNSDILIVVKQDKKVLGTLTLSKGSIDWRPKKKKAGGPSEVQLSWSNFAKLMEEAK